MSRSVQRLLAMLFALMMVAAACGSDSEDAEGGDTTEGAAETTEATDGEEGGDTTETTEAMVEEVTDELVTQFDANGDGSITIGVAAAGPADDGAYYQAVVDAAKQISTDNGFNDVIVVDEIEAADAATALSDLAAQVDIVIVGASEIAEPLGDLTEQFADVFWYCNCGAGFPETPGLAQSLDDGSEVAYTAGVATALLMEGGSSTSVVMIGCCELGFERSSSWPSSWVSPTPIRA